ETGSFDLRQACRSRLVQLAEPSLKVIMVRRLSAVFEYEPCAASKKIRAKPENLQSWCDKISCSTCLRRCISYFSIGQLKHFSSSIAKKRKRTIPMTQNFAISPRILVLAIALLFSLSATALSQEITGSINGTVKDAAGAAVKGATVTITDSQKKV